MTLPCAAPPEYTNYDNGQPRVGPVSRTLPTASFYARTCHIVLKSALQAKRGRFGDEQWYHASERMLRIFELGGCRIRIEGTENLAAVNGPFVLIGNHMSTAETFLLARMVLPFGRLTFVVKRSLVEYPVFKHIMRSRDPVVVGRENPREDLRAVMQGGQERLRAGIRVTVFPQRTRTVEFNRALFNTIGVKLARKAGVPVIPLALKTNAWSNGKRMKDYGPFLPGEPVCFSFGKPLDSSAGDKETHQAVVDFIEERLQAWGVPVASAEGS